MSYKLDLKAVRIVASEEDAGHRSEFPVYKLAKKPGTLTCEASWLNVFIRGTVVVKYRELYLKK